MYLNYFDKLNSGICDVVKRSMNKIPLRVDFLQIWGKMCFFRVYFTQFVKKIKSDLDKQTR